MSVPLVDFDKALDMRMYVTPARRTATDMKYRRFTRSMILPHGERYTIAVILMMLK